MGPITDIISECQRRIIAERSFLLRSVLGDDWKENFGVTDTGHGIPIVRDIFLQKTTWISPDLAKRFFVIEKALVRIEGKRFGFCDRCHEKISDERLLANPCTVYCFSCQRSMEYQRHDNEMVS